jgi:hypothetical protein
MKKGLIIFSMVSVTLVGLCFTSSAQVNLNIKTGFNIARTKDLMDAESNRTGFYAGAQVVVPVAGKLVFQPELLFSAKGYKYRPSAGEKSTAIRMNYVNLPLLVGYNLTKDTKVLLGAELGYFLDAAKRTPYKKESITDSFPEKFDVGIAAGISQKLGNRLGLEVRYIYGLPGFHQVDKAGVRVGEKDAANRVFQAGLFYRII